MRPQLLLTVVLASLLVCAIAAATLTRAAINFRRPSPDVVQPVQAAIPDVKS
jgi:hypothetical protein